jgi:hypothetical protein
VTFPNTGAGEAARLSKDRLMTGSEYALVVVLCVTALAVPLASHRDMRSLKAYRARIAGIVPTEDRRELSPNDRRAVVRAVRRGKPVADPDIAAVLLREHDAVGPRPDYTRRQSIVLLGATAAISVTAGLAGITVVTIGAAAFFLLFLAISAYKWHIRLQIGRSIEATRLLHALP